eukprot:g1940.t1
MKETEAKIFEQKENQQRIIEELRREVSERDEKYKGKLKKLEDALLEKDEMYRSNIKELEDRLSQKDEEYKNARKEQQDIQSENDKKYKYTIEDLEAKLTEKDNEYEKIIKEMEERLLREDANTVNLLLESNDVAKERQLNKKVDEIKAHHKSELESVQTELFTLREKMKVLKEEYDDLNNQKEKCKVSLPQYKAEKEIVCDSDVTSAIEKESGMTDPLDLVESEKELKGILQNDENENVSKEEVSMPPKPPSSQKGSRLSSLGDLPSIHYKKNESTNADNGYSEEEDDFEDDDFEDEDDDDDDDEVVFRSMENRHSKLKRRPSKELPPPKKSSMKKRNLSRMAAEEEDIKRRVSRSLSFSDDPGNDKKLEDRRFYKVNDPSYELSKEPVVEYVESFEIGNFGLQQMTPPTDQGDPRNITLDSSDVGKYFVGMVVSGLGQMGDIKGCVCHIQGNGPGGLSGVGTIEISPLASDDLQEKTGEVGPSERSEEGAINKEAQQFSQINNDDEGKGEKGDDEEEENDDEEIEIDYDFEEDEDSDEIIFGEEFDSDLVGDDVIDIDRGIRNEEKRDKDDANDEGDDSFTESVLEEGVEEMLDTVNNMGDKDESDGFAYAFSGPSSQYIGDEGDDIDVESGDAPDIETFDFSDSFGSDSAF